MNGNAARHNCPITRCQQIIPTTKLMCYTHWRMVPAAAQRALDAAWDFGKGGGSPGLRHAQDAAVKAVEAKLTAKAATP